MEKQNVSARDVDSELFFMIFTVHAEKALHEIEEYVEVISPLHHTTPEQSGVE